MSSYDYNFINPLMGPYQVIQSDFFIPWLEVS